MSLLVLVPERDDYWLSTRYLERFDLGLRAGDALHLAIALNHGARELYSLDAVLVRSAQRLKIKARSPV
jgi:predicted nucleic acid-binding protein